MKKILSALLLIFAMLLSACGGVKYELKDGLMYDADGKEATGTFEFKTGKYKVKGNFVNGLPDGLFEEYYEDGSIMAKETFVNGEMTSKELFYKNGNLLGNFTENDDIKLYYDDGSLILSYDAEKEESIYYHENGNPLMIGNSYETTLYNENNEALFEVKNGESINIGTTLKELEDGTFEILKNNKIIAKIDDKDETLTYLYSTGEKLMTTSSVSGDTEIFFKNGQTFIKVNGVNSRFYYKDGKLLYESNNGEWKFFDRDGKQIMSNFDNITDVKKLN